MLRRFFWTSVIATLVVAVGTAPAALADDAVCQDFAKPQRIGMLGGPQAFSKTAVASPGDLLEKLETHRGELEALLQSRGVGHLYGPIVKAVQSGQGLSERNLERGEVFEWMIYRKTSGPVVAGPLCFAATKTYDAYVIEVTEETMQASNARCEIQAQGTSADQEMSADASGSSSGVEVTMSGPGGAKKVISGGATTWKGLPPGPGDYTFTATARAQGKKTVTTHTFIVPKVCFNLAYLGKETHEAAGETDTCTQTAEVTVKPVMVPPPPPPPPPPPVVKHPAAWTLRAFGLNLGTTDDEVFHSSFRPNGVNERSGLTLGSGEGLGLSLERHFNDRIGLEAALLWADLDALLILDLDEAWGHDEESADFLAITVGPNFHLTPGKRVDFYLGPFVGWASLDDPTFNVLGETHSRKFGDDFVFGGQVGLDVGFGGDWGLHLGVRYIDLTTGDGDNKLDVNPLIGEAGIFYRF